MKITQAEKSDLREILDLQKRCYMQEAEIYNDFEIPPLTQSLESIELEFDEGLFLKAIHEGEIMGSVRALFQRGTCKIGKLIVDSEFQNQGLGKQLMAAIESSFSYASRYELFTGAKSQRNLHLYKKLGYTEFKPEICNRKSIPDLKHFERGTYRSLVESP